MGGEPKGFITYSMKKGDDDMSRLVNTNDNHYSSVCASALLQSAYGENKHFVYNRL
jgi:hypothetical protein